MKCCILLATALFVSAVAAAATPPNVVFIIADDLGWTDLGCQGSTYYETPNIDSLAANGMRFMRYYSSPNCTPSRAALVTGQYGPRTGAYTVGTAERGLAEDRKLTVPVNVTNLPLDRATIGNVFKSAGYATGLFGKWHLGDDGPYHPGQRGFDEALVTMGAHVNFVTTPPVEHPKDEYLADFLTDRGVDFIERHKAEPFFLYLAHFGVHSPHDAKADYVERWKSKPPAEKHWNPLYAAMIQSVDESVGRISETLERLGLTENTVVIFVSDNGGIGGYERTEPPFDGRSVTDNSPLRAGKGTLYEGGLRPPFIVRWPGHVPGRAVCNTPIAHVDLLPTLAEIAGAPLPKQPLDGLSFTPLLRDPTATLGRDAIYVHFPVYIESYFHPRGWRTSPAGAIVTDEWKLIEFFETGRKELYNLQDDIGEFTDLYTARPEIARELEKKLQVWREGIGAYMPERK